MNRSELLTGFLLTICLSPIMGALGLLAIIICPILYAISGMNGQDKIWRRLGVPTMWAIAIFAHCHNWHVLLAIPCSFGALCIGYGIPSIQPPDEGSWLGRFWLRISERFTIGLPPVTTYWWANFLTRGTIYGLALCPMYLFNAF